MTSTRDKISKLKDRVNSKTKETRKNLSEGIKGRDKDDYELVFTVRKHHLRH